MFLDDIPMEMHIVDGLLITWSRKYRGVTYIHSFISLDAAYKYQNKKDLDKHYRKIKKEFNSRLDGSVML